MVYEPVNWMTGPPSSRVHHVVGEDPSPAEVLANLPALLALAQGMPPKGPAAGRGVKSVAVATLNRCFVNHTGCPWQSGVLHASGHRRWRPSPSAGLCCDFLATGQRAGAVARVDGTRETLGRVGVPISEFPR